MQDDLISVIIPVYNCEQYVAQTLDSIMEQTYRNLEILVIDDGSTDGAPAICDRYASDDRVKVFHRPNSGLSVSRQFGVDNCTGAYFVTVDADDYVAADYVEKLYEAIKKNDADISVCGVSCFSDVRVTIGPVFMPMCHEGGLHLTKELLMTDYYRLTSGLIMTDSWNKLHRTQFVRDSGVRFTLEQKYIGQDLQFEHLLALHSPVYCVCRKFLLFHRNREGSMMQTSDKPAQEGFEIIVDSLIEECVKLGISMKE